MLKELSDGMFPVEEEEDLSMYVLTTEYRSYGAAAILYSDILKQAAKKAGSNFFLLPSSIHETILIKDDGTLDAVWITR